MAPLYHDGSSDLVIDLAAKVGGIGARQANLVTHLRQYGDGSAIDRAKAAPGHSQVHTGEDHLREHVVPARIFPSAPALGRLFGRSQRALLCRKEDSPGDGKWLPPE